MSKIKQRSFSKKTSLDLIEKGLNPIIAQLFSARGVKDLSQTTHKIDNLISPDLLLNSFKVGNFIADAIENKKKITIVADYDCDGATSCALALMGLRSMGAVIDYVVPNRFEFGYGLTTEIVDFALKNKKPNIILTVDNGIGSVEGVLNAKKKGIDVIITDHHLPGKILPDTEFIVNPNQPNCKFPSKNLAGVGVIFYVLIATRKILRDRNHFDISNQPKLNLLLDLVALGTITDIVKLDMNNRILVSQGLKLIRKNQGCIGIKTIFEVCNIKLSEATTQDLAFYIGPRLNAAGRLKDISLGIECLITNEYNQGISIAKELEIINHKRKNIQKIMNFDATKIIEKQRKKTKFTISMFDPNWHEGIVGIIASKIKEKYNKPTIIFANTKNKILKGSGRSIPGFHIRDSIDFISKKNPNLIKKFGGHSMAVGLSIENRYLEKFSREFEIIGKNLISQSDLKITYETDGSLDEKHLSINLINEINNQVWGQGFPYPSFCDEFIIISQNIIKNSHLKLKLKKKSFIFDAIWFNHSETVISPVKIIYKLDINKYNGQKKIQLIIDYVEKIL